ncbi:MAG: UDP-N-acetylmuramate--L-alanine ligase [Candidatus Omnitrophota bacterium]|nr:UDP-N-acetylmuramate--L-alanine ligase [Candidatus Omnitrophota bacterium]
MLSTKKKIHFVGIGGIGMSGIAHILLESGYQVSGSDLKFNRLMDQIKSKGAKLFSGHDCRNISEAEVVVYSSAVQPDNPELVMARKKGIPVVKRAQMLSELMNGKISIVVSGTHGKTTTTSLIGSVLLAGGLDPTVIVGGEAKDFGGNAILGKGNYFVAEADESDGSFLFLNPDYSIITNIEEEHLDFYKNLDTIIDTYGRFINNTSRKGILFWHKADENIGRCLAKIKRRNVSFGFSDLADLCAKNIEMKGFSSSFNCSYRKKILGRVTVNLPFSHNILNALAAIGPGLELGMDFDSINRALSAYHGVDRRFQVKLNSSELMVIDDYAHHPTEVKATLGACRALGKRIICVFQPHRYSRTRHLGKRFAEALCSVDHLILAEIYPADEKPLAGVSSRCIYDELKKRGREKVDFAVSKEEALKMVEDIIRPQDLVVVMGAGNINYVADKLTQIYADKQQTVKLSN